ncbi:retrovirus-related Pol polyprotein from transposon TNT 1-94, partial [Trifolium pratense]
KPAEPAACAGEPSHSCLCCANNWHQEPGSITGTRVNCEGINWRNTKWSAVMKSLFGAQECLEVVVNGYDELGANPTNDQINTYKENKKKD